MNRMGILRSFFKASDIGLEIGPSYNPVAPKSQGYNVETIDYMSAANLKEKYRNNSTIDISLIEEVDYVTNGQRITNSIKNKHYDYIIASHVIEHIPDFISFLLDCDSFLKEDGVLILAVPDKRFWFDVFQSLTSTGDVLQAYFEQRTRHISARIFDFYAYNAYNDGRLAWSKDTIGSLQLTHSIAEARQLVDNIGESDKYHDIHGWHFVPASFRLIINDLNQAGYVPLKEKSFYDTLGFEFFITMSRQGKGCPLDRQTLLKDIYSENFKRKGWLSWIIQKIIKKSLL